MNSDSVMQIAKERLGSLGFKESRNKPGLFYKNTMIERKVAYIDMRTNPLRMYGYLEGKPIPNEEIEDDLRDAKRQLITIGCLPIDKFEEE